MTNDIYISLEALAAKTALPQAYLKELADAKRIPFLDVNGRKRFNPELVGDALRRIQGERHE